MFRSKAAQQLTAHLLSLELLEAVLPVFGKLGLLVMAGLSQGSLDLHLPLPTPATTLNGSFQAPMWHQETGHQVVPPQGMLQQEALAAFGSA